MCLNATYQVAGKSGERRIAAREFYQGAYFTALEAGDVLTAVRIPVPAAGHGYAYEKLKRKIGDYATAAAAVVLTMKGGKVESCSIGLDQCRRNAALGRGGGENPRRLHARCRDGEKSRGRRRSDHRAGRRRARPGAIPHQNGGRDAHARARSRQIARTRLMEQEQMAKSQVAMKINGKTVEALVEPRTLLIHFLRDDLSITGPHIGCETSHCGACTVDLDGKSVKSCTVFAVQANGADIRTIEGIANADGTLHALQEGFREMHGLQCGFCTPGMITRAYRLAPGESKSDRGGNSLRHLRQSVPLHRLSEHRQSHSIRRRQAQRRAVPGGRRMNDMTPTSAERAVKLEGIGCKRKRVEDVRFTQGKGNYVDDVKLPGMLLRRLQPLAPRPCPHQEDRHHESRGGARRRRGAHRRNAENRQPRLDADARRRRADGARRRQGAVPEPGGRLRHRRRPLCRGRRRRSGRGRIRSAPGQSSIRSRPWPTARR